MSTLTFAHRRLLKGALYGPPADKVQRGAFVAELAFRRNIDITLRQRGDFLIYERAQTLMEAELGDELVGLEPGAGNCFGFNEVVKRVWQLLEQPRSFLAIRSVLLDEYAVAPAECDADLHELLTDLIDNKLITARL